MPSGMTAEAFCEKHGRAIVRWLRDNTTECDCDSALKFGADEKLAHKKEDKKVKRLSGGSGELKLSS